MFLEINIKYIMALYIIFINILSMFIMQYDKYMAIKNKWRIPEKFIIFMALIFGDIGVLIRNVPFSS